MEIMLSSLDIGSEFLLTDSDCLNDYTSSGHNVRSSEAVVSSYIGLHFSHFYKPGSAPLAQYPICI